MSSVSLNGGKHTTAQGYAIIKHDYRESENYANEDVDKSRSHLNKYYKCQTAEEARNRLKARILECDALHPPKRVKSDRKTSLQMILFAPRADTEDDERLDLFFEKFLERAEQMFGSDNIIYAYTHRDEIHDFIKSDGDGYEMTRSRAHMGITIVPFTDDCDWISPKFRAGLNMHNLFRRDLPNRLNDIADEVCMEIYSIPYRDGSKLKSKKTMKQLKAESKALQEQQEAIQENQRILEEQEKRMAQNQSLEQELNNRQERIESEEAELQQRAKNMKATLKEQADRQLKRRATVIEAELAAKYDITNIEAYNKWLQQNQEQMQQLRQQQINDSISRELDEDEDIIDKRKAKHNGKYRYIHGLGS